MAISLADQYFLKAMDYYPFNLEDAVENLSYALGYDEDHPGANYLMGKLYMEQFGQFEKAESHFVAALSADPCHVKTCKSYAWLMLRTRQFDRALKLLQYAKGLTGANKPKLLHLEALVYESLYDYEEARKSIKQAISECYSSGYITFLEEELERINKKERKSNMVNYQINE